LAELLEIKTPFEDGLSSIHNDIYDVKELIEENISANFSNLSMAKPIVAFYDLTEVYFDHKAIKAKSRPGKDPRWPVISLAMVLDELGLVRRSEIFAGQAWEAGFLEAALAKLKAPKGSQVALAPGLAGAKEIEWLNQAGYSWFVLSHDRKSNFDFEKASPIGNDSELEIKVYKEISKDKKEATLFCYKRRKNYNNQPLWSRPIQRLTDHDQNLDHNSGLGLRIPFYRSDQPAIERQGAYTLRCNQLDISLDDLWLIFGRLASGQCLLASLKSALKPRIIDNSQPRRFESDIFITVLAYQGVQILLNILKSSGINYSWWNLRAGLTPHRRVSTIFIDEDGKAHEIRKNMMPETWQADIYRALRLPMV
jgi:hypothetical protein